MNLKITVTVLLAGSAGVAVMGTVHSLLRGYSEIYTAMFLTMAVSQVYTLWLMWKSEEGKTKRDE